MDETNKKVFRPANINVAEDVQKTAVDAVERQSVVAQMELALNKYSEGKVVKWNAYEVELQEGSSLYELYNPGRMLFNQLLATGPVIYALHRESASDHNGLIRVTASGGLEVHGDSGWVNLSTKGYFDLSASTISTLILIAGLAEATSGYIWADLDLPLDQWFRFHDLPVPQNKEQTTNLINYFKFDPVVGALGNYWGQLDSDDHSFFALSAEHCEAIRLVTRQLLSPGEKLLDVLHNRTSQPDITSQNASEWMSKVVGHSFSLELASAYLDKLQWFGSQPGETPSKEDLASLLVTAVLLDIHPSIGATRSRKAIGAMELYAPGRVNRHPSVLCKELELFLTTERSVTPAMAPVAAHLLLAGIAPELQVKGMPSSLMMGSVEWMSFCCAVKLVDSVRQGASRVLNHAQIIAYAELEPLSEAHTQMRQLAMIDPMVDWALINGVVTSVELASNEKATTERAMSTFQMFADNFVSRTGTLPSRRLIAKNVLEDAAPLCDFLEDKVLYQRPGLFASPTATSMVDLHMSGDLVGGDWDRREVFPDVVYSQNPTLHAGVTQYKPTKYHDPSVKSIYDEFPRLRRLRSVNEELHRQVRTYEEKLNRSLNATVKYAISNMPVEDLQAFLSGNVTFFTFRDDASYLHTQSFSAQFIPGYKLEKTVETREVRDAVTGRFGLLMCVNNGDELIAYELFTLRGELKKNIWLGKYLARSGFFQTPARLDFSGDPAALESPVIKEHLRIDLHKYLHGDSSKTKGDGRAIPEKLGELVAAPNPVRVEKSPFKNFSNPQLSRLAEFIVTHHPIVKFSELLAVVSEQTALEKEREKGDKIATYIVDLVVPFKKCIEDITSGEQNRVVDGIYGCMMDAVSLGGAFYGAGAKALSISAKSISAANKAARVAKLVVTSSVSLLNPVDGVPTALYGVGKFVHGGLLRFSRSTLELLGLARVQLDTLHGVSKGANLIRTSEPLLTGHGTWYPKGSGGRSSVVFAMRRHSQWYALDRVGRPWGPKLGNFKLAVAGRLPRAVKTSSATYTRLIVPRSLPRVQTKIDNALNIMTQPAYKSPRESLIKLLLGNDSSAAIGTTVDILRLIRADFAGMSISNIFLDPHKDSNSIAEFDLDAYKEWKKAGSRTNQAFIQISVPNINRQFIASGFNHDVIADGLIHELFHGVAQNNDVSYALDVKGDKAVGQKLDVTALLNLALGRLAVEGSDNTFHPSSKAFQNADSLAVLTSLLSQIDADKSVFDSNMRTMLAAIAASGGGVVAGPVVIRLNTTPDS
jgi:hypothetical protein